jgi:DNA-binding SARP family transcriptional activator/Tfp pilus assembly protein PilF
VLTFLACQRDWITRDHLATLFWPDQAQEAARSNLRKVLFRLRESGLDNGLESRGEQVRLIVDTDVNQLRHALQAGDASHAANLFRGPLLEGFEAGAPPQYARWLAYERDALSAHWRQSVLMGLDGKDPEAQAELTARLLASDPFDEDALALHLIAQQRLGRFADAARRFATFRAQLADELGIEPSLRLRALAADIVTQQVAPAAPAAAAALTATTAAQPATAPAQGFVGRRAEVKELAALLARPECRIVTIIGPGGVGKSSLLREATRLPIPDDCVLVRLDDLPSADAAARRIADQLNVDIRGDGPPWAALAAALAQRRLILGLDNAEHLADLPAALGALLDTCAQLRVIASSRQRLGLHGEVLLPLEGLPVPDAGSEDLEAASQFDAVKLFRARALVVDPRFDIGTQLPGVLNLLRRTDGLPLAIELAAAWVRLLPAAEIDTAVAESLDALQTDDALPRARPEHATIRATLQSSWDLLAPAERQALAALSLLRGAFGRATAQSVAGAPLPVLASLVDKSLLQSDGAGRFRLHPLIERFATEQAAATPDALLAAQQRHVAHYASLVRPYRERQRTDPQPLLRLFSEEFENLRSASQLALDLPEPAPQHWPVMAQAAAFYFENTGRYREGLDWFAPALRLTDAGQEANRALALRFCGILNYRAGLLEAAVDCARRGEQLSRQQADVQSVKACVNVLGLCAWQRGDLEQARLRFQEAMALATADGDRRGVAAFASNLALVEKSRGHDEQSLALYEQALALDRELGLTDSIVNQLNNIGNHYRRFRDEPRAIAHFEEALRLCEQHGLTGLRSAPLVNLGLSHLQLGHTALARDYLERCLQATREGGDAYLGLSAQIGLARTTACEGRLAESLQLLQTALAGISTLGDDAQRIECLLAYAEWMDAVGETPQAVAMMQLAWQLPQADADERREVERWLRLRSIEPVAVPRSPIAAAAALDTACAELRLRKPPDFLAAPAAISAGAR